MTSDHNPANLARHTLDRAFSPSRLALAIAPGRVNLIGEHVDYNDGLVLPIAINLHTAVAAARSTSPRTRLLAADLNQRVEIPAPARVAPDPGSMPAWARYPAGVLHLLAALQPEPPPPLDLAVASNIPMGAGLSSSAALEIAVALAACRAWNVSPPAPLDLAKLAQRAEHEFAGVPCGLMDQAASLLARADHALLLDCQDLAVSHVPIPNSLAVLILDTGVRHELATSQYARRRDDCRLAASALGLESLRHATPSDVERLTDPRLQRRTRHVVTEIARVGALASALRVRDAGTIGLLLNASHASLRDDYQVSCPELDAAAEFLRRQPGVLGARMTGGGFGGSVIALVEASHAPETLARASAVARGLPPTLAHPVAGAWELNQPARPQ